MSKYDWPAIQAYYDQGHTVEECKLRFGFANGAWDSAVGRGDINPRSHKTPRFRHDTREAVKKLLAAGMSQTEAAFELGLSKGTVCYHVRQLGIEGDSRFRRRYDWAEIQRAQADGMSMRECQRAFGFSTAAWHEARKRGALETRAPGIPIEELLVAGRPRSRGHLRARLLKAGLKEERCERCGLDEWRDPPLRVTLHHVNGDPYDNRLENLAFLCPNCHSQTPNFGGRNGHLRPKQPREPL
jgi:DNA-binding CsgD family transcriptional regulator